jgi:diguanylate cyclase (GGDEF)-like protein
MAANAALQRNLREIDALQEQLREQAIRDPLTGLYNRRYLDATLERELARSQRDGQPLALILMDLDHFKRVNDTYGHQAGDEVLQQLAKLLTEMARAGDVASRHGGEVPAADAHHVPGHRPGTGRSAAPRLRRHGDPLRQPEAAGHLSIGIAACPDHGTAEDLFRHADRALYQAKHEGGTGSLNQPENLSQDRVTAPRSTLACAA